MRAQSGRLAAAPVKLRRQDSVNQPGQERRRRPKNNDRNEAVDEIPAEVDQPPLLEKRARTDREIVFQRSEQRDEERQDNARAQQLRQVDDEMVVCGEKTENWRHRSSVPSWGGIALQEGKPTTIIPARRHARSAKENAAGPWRPAAFPRDRLAYLGDSHGPTARTRHEANASEAGDNHHPGRRFRRCRPRSPRQRYVGEHRERRFARSHRNQLKGVANPVPRERLRYLLPRGEPLPREHPTSASSTTRSRESHSETLRR